MECADFLAKETWISCHYFYTIKQAGENTMAKSELFNHFHPNLF